MSELRALSLHQPYASLCVPLAPGEEPVKTIETRGKPLKYRGILIHDDCRRLHRRSAGVWPLESRPASGPGHWPAGPTLGRSPRSRRLPDPDDRPQRQASAQRPPSPSRGGVGVGNRRDSWQAGRSSKLRPGRQPTVESVAAGRSDAALRPRRRHCSEVPRWRSCQNVMASVLSVWGPGRCDPRSVSDTEPSQGHPVRDRRRSVLAVLSSARRTRASETSA